MVCGWYHNVIEGECRVNSVNYLPSMNRSTDQVRHAEYEATAMDAYAVIIHGHRFHHSTVMTALDTHAQVSHAAVVDAIAAHDGHVNAGNIHYNDI